VNAVSHWLWKEKAIYKQSSSVRYSASGYCIHHAASIFWAMLYEKWATRSRKPPTPTNTLTRAAAVSSIACLVDMQCTPERLTPGFERRLSRKSLLMVYAAFGLGLALHTLLDRRR
jgi:hypothetical protein